MKSALSEQVCPECEGKGEQPGMPGMDCGSCLGTGTELVEVESLDSGKNHPQQVAVRGQEGLAI